MIIGAGCSIERPTGLRLSKDYSERIHRDLVADGVIASGDCSSPGDLSELASVVFQRSGSQAAVVRGLPITDFKLAKANAGYLAAAALMREGSISIIATLNYDLAMTDALRQLDAKDVEEIAGPLDLDRLGSKALIYLHRNANESDPEAWILRKEALDDEWRDSWEGVMANRLVASPVVLFAGLGSPAAVLTESLTRVRAILPDRLEAFLADPSDKSDFATALDLPEENCIRAFWGEFMEALSQRVVQRSVHDLVDACVSLCGLNGWAYDSDAVQGYCESFGAHGLVALGRLRANWLATGSSYEPDNAAYRPMIADLLMALGLIAGATGATLALEETGMALFREDGNTKLVVLPVCGRGVTRWAQIEGIIANRGGERPDIVLAGAISGTSPANTAPPADIVMGDTGDDISIGRHGPYLVTIDDLRIDIDTALRRVA